MSRLPAKLLNKLTFGRIPSIFSRVMALRKCSHFKLVSKISRELFKLGARNLVNGYEMMSRVSG